MPAKRHAARADPRLRAELERRLRLEGWRLVLKAVSILAMGGVVVTVFWPGPAALLLSLRLQARGAEGVRPGEVGVSGEGAR